MKQSGSQLNIREVAQKLGVSTATVSFTLNNRPGVSDAVRKRVMETVKEMGYVPNLVGKVINRKKTGIVGVIVPISSGGLFPSIVDGISTAAEKSHTPVFVSYCQDNSQIELKMLRLFNQFLPEGLIIATVADFNNLDVFEDLARNDTPIVQIERTNPGIPGDYMGSNHAAAVEACIRELIEKGKRKIGLVQSGVKYTFNRELIKGWKKALKNAGITPDPDWLLEYAPWEKDFRNVASEYLTRKNRCDGILWCESNPALKDIFTKHGLVNGRDLELVLFDGNPIDLPEGQTFVNYAQDGYALGRESFQLLSKWSEKPETFKDTKRYKSYKRPYVRETLTGIVRTPVSS